MKKRVGEEEAEGKQKFQGWDRVRTDDDERKERGGKIAGVVVE